MLESRILNIESDHGRFRKIVKGKIRENLRGYVARGELIGRKGRDLVSIPVPYIDLPHFEHDFRERGGVGQGEGGLGTPVAAGPGGDQEGEAGDAPGAHILEVDVTLEELAQILGEELELPRIEPKGRSEIESERHKYASIRAAGPDSMVHFKRTFREALKRQIATGEYDPAHPVIVPVKRDKRYLTWRKQLQPRHNALIVYMMDVSGSMRDEQKEIVRAEAFWIDTWLRSQYKGIASRFIVHDAEAHEVDRETFFTTRESGGTVISSAYELCANILHNEYPVEEWNVYPFHFSDGDNWSEGDSQRCVDILRQYVLPRANMFGYGQVKSRYGSGKFHGFLEEHLGRDERVTLSLIEDKDGIVDSIRDFFGKGR
jgi:uncharacterized protein